MGQTLFANSNCIGCGICAKSCTNNAISMKGNRAPLPYWKYNCEACLRCMSYCRQKAVEAGHSWAAIIYLIWIWGYPIVLYMFNFFGFHLPFVNTTMHYYMLWIVMAIYLYPAYIIAYFAFFHLLRLKPLNTLFTYTTLAHFYRRYHEPEIALIDLQRREHSNPEDAI